MDFQHLLNQRLRDDNIEGYCKVEDEILNRQLENQLIKHESNYGHLFEQQNDKESLVDLKQSVVESSFEESLFRTTSVQKVDLKTQSLIKLLKNT
jgi:hypothetical protein